MHPGVYVAPGDWALIPSITLTASASSPRPHQGPSMSCWSVGARENHDAQPDVLAPVEPRGPRRPVPPEHREPLLLRVHVLEQALFVDREDRDVVLGVAQALGDGLVEKAGLPAGERREDGLGLADRVALLADGGGQVEQQVALLAAPVVVRDAPRDAGRTRRPGARPPPAPSSGCARRRSGTRPRRRRRCGGRRAGGCPSSATRAAPSRSRTHRVGVRRAGLRTSAGDARRRAGRGRARV